VALPAAGELAAAGLAREDAEHLDAAGELDAHEDAAGGARPARRSWWPSTPTSTSTPPGDVLPAGDAAAGGGRGRSRR
jgi:hypothetical protein